MTARELVLSYLGALLAIARVDGALGRREQTWIRHVLRLRFGIEVTDEMMWETQPEGCTPDTLRGDLGLALIDDAVVLAIVDGPVNELEVQALVELGRIVDAPVTQVDALRRRD